jgi:hypothetical protein
VGGTCGRSISRPAAFEGTCRQEWNWTRSTHGCRITGGTFGLDGENADGGRLLPGESPASLDPEEAVHCVAVWASGHDGSRSACPGRQRRCGLRPEASTSDRPGWRWPPASAGRVGCHLLGNMGTDPDAGVAHSVERNLAKVEVAGSKPVSRSNSSFPIPQQPFRLLPSPSSQASSDDHLPLGVAAKQRFCHEDHPRQARAGRRRTLVHQ